MSDGVGLQQNQGTVTPYPNPLASEGVVHRADAESVSHLEEWRMTDELRATVRDGLDHLVRTNPQLFIRCRRANMTAQTGSIIGNYDLMNMI